VDEMSNTDPNEHPPFPDGQPDKDPDKPMPNDVKSYAYSYPRNVEPIVGAVFKWKTPPPEEKAPYSAEGVVINTPNCSFKLVRKLLENGHTTYPDTKSEQKVVDDDKVHAFLTPNRKVKRGNGTENKASDLKPVTIEWTVYNKDNIPISKSRSTHTLYVTWIEKHYLKETYFNLSCVMADGEKPTTEDGKKIITNKIFSDFEDLDVLRMDGSSLGYYRNENNTTDSDVLIMMKDGQCAAHVRLMDYALDLAGVTSKCQEIKPNGIDTRDTRLLVKNWTFENGSLPPLWTHRFQELGEPPSEVTPLPEGVQGQGKLNPVIKRFQKHFIIEYSNVIYDPSYGKKFEGADAQTLWEDASLSGLDSFGRFQISPGVFQDDIAVAKPVKTDERETVFEDFDL
jgi:hypothetical protein